MKKKPVFMFVSLVVAVAGSGAWFLSRPLPADANAGHVAPVALVSTAVVEDRSLASTVEAFGVVAPSAAGEQAMVAPFDGVIARVLATPGTQVAAGVALIELTPSADAKLLLDSARGALTLATRALANARERYDLKLTGDTEWTAAQQVEQDARLKVASLEARGLGGDGRINAPVAGVVGRVDAYAGVQVATGALLVVVVASSGLEAKLGVESAVAGAVKVGQSVTLVSLGRPLLKTVTGRVTSVGVSIDAPSGEVVVRAALPDDAEFFGGEHLRGRIEIARHTALAVLQEAVLPDGNAQVLFAVHEGKAVRHEVMVGIVDGDHVEVSGTGVAAGDVVVTQGNHELSDGLAVRTGPEATP